MIFLNAHREGSIGKIKMAKIRRSKTKKFQKSKRKKSVVRVSLPKKPSKPPSDFKNISILLHGEKKIGKSSLFVQEPNAFFLEFDPLQPYKILQRQVPDWPHFLAYIDLLETNPGNVETVILDGVDICYQACFDWCCTKLVIQHPHDEDDYGRSWKFIRTEFEKAMLRVLNLEGIAARFISHSKWTKVESHTGKKINKLVPFLTTQAEEVLGGRVDLWAAYQYSGKRRILTIKGDETISAGHRIDEQFRTPDGEPIEEIYMGKSPKEAYKNLLEAFDNEQIYTTVDELDLKKKKKKRKVRVKIR